MALTVSNRGDVHSVQHTHKKKGRPFNERAIPTTGWLINIENKVNIEQVKFLRDFVALLRKECHARHSESTVLWYDSVTDQGHLEWQNELTAHNKMFFDAADGIFLNYTWRPENLTRSAILAGQACVTSG
jgi:mannosyl-glycoprotein endo-beta-N-acetylglucosaminidase